MGRQPHINSHLKSFILIITKDREQGLQGLETLLLVIVRVKFGKHALQGGVFLTLFIFIYVLFLIASCVYFLACVIVCVFPSLF
jgi:uncharacterized membrane protein